VGQEVVSRMEHRGLARTRAVPVRFDNVAPRVGVAVTAGERQVGRMGSAADGRGLALLRLDRVAEAMSRGEPLLAGGVAIRLAKPDWAHFDFPGQTEAAQ
jgi:tRNA-modifying protein YgfZ